MRVSLLSAITTLALVLLPGCEVSEKVMPPLYGEPVHKVKSIEFFSTQDMNQSTAVAVDLVFIFDPKLVDELTGMTARSWFSERQGYMASYPQALVVSSYEFVPGFVATIDPTAIKAAPGNNAKKAKAVVLFADYLVESKAYTLDVSHFKNPVVTLGHITISVSE